MRIVHSGKFKPAIIKTGIDERSIFCLIKEIGIDQDHIEIEIFCDPPPYPLWFTNLDVAKEIAEIKNKE